jgi:hypothetical protein
MKRGALVSATPRIGGYLSQHEGPQESERLAVFDSHRPRVRLVEEMNRWRWPDATDRRDWSIYVGFRV